MDWQTFQNKTAGSDARYQKFEGDATHFELVEIITEEGQGPGVWVYALDENGQFLPGVLIQNWYPESESGRGEVFFNTLPHVEFIFGVGNKYLTHEATPPDKIRVYNQNTDEVWVGVPDGIHFRWTMIFKRKVVSPAPVPTPPVSVSSNWLIDLLFLLWKLITRK